MDVKNYLAKFDANGNRGATIPLDGTISADEIKSYESQGYVIISAEDWGYYVGAHGTGDNGTGYIRDTKTGKPVSAPPAPAVEEEPQELPVDPERLAVYEAMAAQEARLVAHGERIAALEAALKAKGGEGK
mgnify:CR=1 FL=1